MTPEQIAQVVHEANRAFQRILGEDVSPPWDEFPPERRTGTISGVLKALDGADPAELHDKWCEGLRAQGWTYGEVKNDSAKTHPCLISYDDLPEVQRRKDDLLASIAGALDDRPEPGDYVFTVYLSIGNSDDKLGQAEWATFHSVVADTVALFAEQIHGVWVSPSVSPYQNACWCFEMQVGQHPALREQLARLGRRYRQDSIAVAYTGGPMLVEASA